MYINKFIGRAVVASSMLALAVPAYAAPLTSSQASQVIQLLQSFNVDQNVISGVQTTLSGFVGSGTTQAPASQGGTCPTITRNLGMGSRGDDVKQLQQMLAEDSDSGFSGVPTGVFGSQTAKAMKRFQMRNGISSSTTGTVGSMTRAFFDRKCGRGEGEQRGGMGMRGLVSGTIAAANGSSITIQTPDNKTITATVSASTSIQVFAGTSTPPTQGSLSDLVVGKNVAVDGPKNADGSVNAVHIRVGFLLPLMMQDRHDEQEQGDNHGGPMMGGNQGNGFGAPMMQDGRRSQGGQGSGDR